MIIVKLMGGLGNQMFQYAAGRRLSLLNNTQLKLDISSLSAKGNTPRDYELKHLSINAVIATAAEIDLLRWQGVGLVLKLLSAGLRLVGKKCPLPSDYREPHFRFDPSFSVSPDDRYLDGYWQSEKYFDACTVEIRDEFAVRDPLEGRNLELAELISETESVSLHVRRGDFVNNAEASNYHGICGLEYYDHAIKRISEDVSHPAFYVFSDDPTWVKANLVIPFPTTFISHNASRGHEDLRLMSLCKHNIIANSSFSWWGAWLNQNSDKIVVAPSRWFTNPKIDTRDLLPESWLRITA